MKSFKQFKQIYESIIDIPRKTYAKAVFDNPDTPNPELKASVKKQVLDGIKSFEKFGKVVKYGLIGSILTKQYRGDADLDVNILFDIPGSKEEQEKIHEKIKEHQYEINGKTIPGSEHPINYFSIIDPAIFDKANKMADGIFDIDKNKWIKKPEPGKFEPEKYMADFQKRVSEIDVVKGELARDMIDYEELKELGKDDIENLEGLVSKKLSEIKDSINTLVDIGAKTVTDRKDAFLADMSPDEVRKFGVKNRLPKNVIYKMLEKYHYLKFFKTLEEIMSDGKITPDELKSLSKIKEAKGRHIAFTFGRFNPPTIGHGKLLEKLFTVRADNHFIFLSRSEDSDKNPLSFREKSKVMKQMFPRYASNIIVSGSNRVFDIVTDLYNKGATELSMVVGSDRVREFDTTIKKYNGVKSRHGYYNFDNINIVSAGERDPDADGATGMSASKMRAAAKSNDLVAFKKGLPSTFRDAEGLLKRLRQGMRLAASNDPEIEEGTLKFKPFITASTKEELENMIIRDKYLTEHLYDVGDIVDDVENKITGVIVRRGTNYVTLEDVDSKLHKSWLFNIIESPVYPRELDESARKLKYDKETDQPKKYVAGLSDKEKKSHDRHLEKQGKKSDDDKSAYKQSPADKVAKTKPSVHTKKFKQMYGELKTEKEPQKRGDEFVDTGLPESSNSDGDKVLHLKLLGKALKTMPQSSKQKEIIKQINVVRKRLGYKPLSESYEIGHDYAKYTSSITPGQKNYDPKFQGGSYKPSDSKNNLINVNADKKVDLKDIEEWISDSETIDKYKERYGEDWQSKLDEVYNKMFNKVVDTSENSYTTKVKDVKGDLKTMPEEDFESKYKKSKSEMKVDVGGNDMKLRSFKEHANVNEAIDYHLQMNVPICENIFRHNSSAFFEFYNRLREKVVNEKIELSAEDKEFLDTDIGTFGLFEGNEVALDCPMLDEEDEKNPPIGKPKRGGPKKFYVYVKDGDKVKKVTWGDTSGLSVKMNDPEARKSFAARHQCSTQKDRTSAAYWACNTPRYAKQLGLSGGGSFFW